MTPAGLLQTLRRLGVVVAVEGDRLRFQTRRGRVPADLRAGVAGCRADVAALVLASWWPADCPRPNLFDLGNAHGAAAIRARLAEVGCDIAERDPTWEELFVVAAVLEGQT